MSSPQEDISLVEFVSPKKPIKPKRFKNRNNRITSPPPHSPANKPTDDTANVVSIFSVKNTRPASSRKQSILENDEIESITTTELSDDVFAKEQISEQSKSEKSYKNKIRERFNLVKERASSSSKKSVSHKSSRENLLLGKIRKESSDIDAEIINVRSKYTLRDKEDVNFSFFTSTQPVEDVKAEDSNISDSLKDNDLMYYYYFPDQFAADFKSFQAEFCFTPSNKPVPKENKLEAGEPRFLEEEGLFITRTHHIPRKHINILEQRLVNCENKKWFNCEGDLDVLESPLVKVSLRPKTFRKNPNIVYIPATNNVECNEIVVVQDNMLDVHLNSIKFRHHPLFSVEHVFEQRLIALFEQYKYDAENNTLQRLMNKLEAIRQVRKNFENVKKDSEGEDRIVKYDSEIKDLRNLCFDEGKRQRETIKSLLETWRIIKKIREINEYSSTKVKLVIQKEKADIYRDEVIYKKKIQETFKEILTERKNEFKRELKRYKKQMKFYKESQKDDEKLLEELPKKPIYNINEEKLKEELEIKFTKCFKEPGEPILNFALVFDNDITKEIADPKELIRRNAVNSTKIFLKVTCMKMDVCKTAPVSLDDAFECYFNESFSIQLANIPKIIVIEVMEQPKSLLKRKICELHLNVPAQTLITKEIVTESFEKFEIVHYKHNGVGSGFNLASVLTTYKIRLDYDLVVNTAGCLNYGLRWRKIVNKENCITKDTVGQIINEILDKHGTIDLNKLNEWVASNTPDPQDPKNLILYEYTAGFTKDLCSFKEPEQFRLDRHLETFQFCDISELENNLRLMVLQLRNQNEIEFDGMTISNRLKEIPLNALSDYKKRIATDNEDYQETNFEDEIESLRNHNRKYLRQVHNKVFQKCKNFDDNLLYENVVNEKYLAYFEQMIKVLLTNFLNWFSWKPKISQPLPTVDHSTSENYEIHESTKIIFHILSVSNVPKRKICSKFRTTDQSNETIEDVQLFIQINYNDFSIKTSTSKGANAEWNEILSIPLESQHTDYLNPNSLSGTITLNLYDSIVDNTSTDEEENKFNWLGCVEIPLSAICTNNSIEGKFKLKIPYLFDYENEIDKQLTKSPRLSNVSVSHQISYIEMKAYIEPNIPKLTPNMRELPSNDVPFIQEHILKWNEAYNNNFPHRKFSAFAIDTFARTNCITKYIKPLEPPPINSEGFDITPEQCCKFLSLIPFTECNQFYENVWLTTDQFLNLMIGSTVDHAVALTCYLLALNMDAWLLLGFGSPTGSAACVLVKEYARDNDLPKFYIYDVMDNEKYDVTDLLCPLQKVYCLVNGTNVWANIQRNDNVNFLRFDIKRRSDWLPLFDNHIGAPMNFTNVKVIYKSDANTEYIEQHLEKRIRKKISKLRKCNRTIWKHNISIMLKDTLRSLELHKMFNKSNFEVISELNDMIADRKLTGFIINTIFEKTSTILRKIEATGIHIQDSKTIEFGLAVYVQSYQNNLSIWICLACVQN